LLLPEDVIIAQKLEAGSPAKTVSVREIPDGWIIADIGPEAARQFGQEVKSSKTALWNGPMGVFEIQAFAQGTREVAKAMAESKGTTVVGGGSSVEAIEGMGLTNRITHVSTGGGASLELLEGLELPGVAVLMNK
jgi:phosphoglycerate kinase